MCLDAYAREPRAARCAQQTRHPMPARQLRPANPRQLRPRRRLTRRLGELVVRSRVRHALLLVRRSFAHGRCPESCGDDGGLFGVEKQSRDRVRAFYGPYARFGLGSAPKARRGLGEGAEALRVRRVSAFAGATPKATRFRR